MGLWCIELGGPQDRAAFVKYALREQMAFCRQEGYLHTFPISVHSLRHTYSANRGAQAP